jgi:4-oxalocrotonate tautomerase
MPVVTIEMWEGRTREQKARLAKAITDAVVEIAKTSPEHVHVVFYDVAKSDWAIAGKLSDED